MPPSAASLCNAMKATYYVLAECFIAYLFVYVGESSAVLVAYNGVKQCRGDNVLTCVNVGIATTAGLFVYASVGALYAYRNYKALWARIPALPPRFALESPCIILLWDLLNVVAIVNAVIFYVRTKPFLIDLDAKDSDNIDKILRLLMAVTFLSGAWMFVMCQLIPGWLWNLECRDRKCCFHYGATAASEKEAKLLEGSDESDDQQSV